MTDDDQTECAPNRSPIRSIAVLGAVVVLGGAVLLSGCSSTSGGGSTPARSQVIVLPPGQTVVCTNGSAPPCH